MPLKRSEVSRNHQPLTQGTTEKGGTLDESSGTSTTSITLVTYGNESDGSLSVMEPEVTSTLSRFDAVVLTSDGNVRGTLQAWTEATHGEYIPYLTVHHTLPIRAHTDKYSDHPTCIQIQCATLTCDVNRKPQTLTFVTDQRYLVVGVLVLKPDDITLTNINLRNSNEQSLENVTIIQRSLYTKILAQRPLEASIWNLTFTPLYTDRPLTSRTPATLKVKIIGKPGGSWKDTITLSVSLSVTIIDFNEKFIAPKIVADISYGLLPISSENMTLTALIVLPNMGKTLDISLTDDGKPADMLSRDGQYSGYIPEIASNGTYTVTVHAHSGGFQYHDTDVVAASGIIMTEERGNVIHIPAFERSSEPQFFTVLNRPMEPSDPIPPAKVVDLTADANKTLCFRFTPPGDDLETGQAELCRIYHNSVPRDLLNESFYSNDNHLLEILGKDIKMTAEGHLVQLDAEQQKRLNRTGTYYFSVRCVDHAVPSGNWGPVSNIAAAVVRTGLEGAQPDVAKAPMPASAASLEDWVWILVTLGSLVALFLIGGTIVVGLKLSDRNKSKSSREIQPKGQIENQQEIKEPGDSLSSTRTSSGSDTSSSGSEGPVVFENSTEHDVEAGSNQQSSLYHDNSGVTGTRKFGVCGESLIYQQLLRALVSGGLEGTGSGAGLSGSEGHPSHLECQGGHTNHGQYQPMAIHVYHHYPPSTAALNNVTSQRTVDTYPAAECNSGNGSSLASGSRAHTSAVYWEASRLKPDSSIGSSESRAVENNTPDGQQQPSFLPAKANVSANVSSISQGLGKETTNLRIPVDEVPLGRGAPCIRNLTESVKNKETLTFNHNPSPHLDTCTAFGTTDSRCSQPEWPRFGRSAPRLNTGTFQRAANTAGAFPR